MRKAWIILVVLGFALFCLNQWRLTRQIKALQAERDATVQAEPASAPQSSDVELRNTQQKLDQANLELAAARKKISDLETKLATAEHKPAGPLPDSFIVASNAPAPDPSQPPKRNWGPEQATGPPDTPNAGDIPTAWASLESNAGVEWLQLNYQTLVNIAQIRVRETLNPGAVFKITAFTPAGQEFTLWQGTETAGAAPYESVFDVPPGMFSRSIRIYLDSTRVPGWNEIDAVELVATDGLRQWASTASASSTYAERSAPPVAASQPGDSQ